MSIQEKNKNSFLRQLLRPLYHFYLKQKPRLKRLPWVWRKYFSRVKPISDVYGYDRGTPIGRYYIEDFLKKNQQFIHGYTLEVNEDTYTLKFGGAKVSAHEIMDIDPENIKATLIADLTKPDTLPSEKFDCFVCTHTLNVIYDLKAAVHGIHQVLKPGGSALVTVAGISKFSRYDLQRWGDYWRFSTFPMQKLFEDVFGKDYIQIDYYGNSLAVASAIRGFAAEELSQKQLMIKDPAFPLVVTVLAHKGRVKQT